MVLTEDHVTELVTIATRYANSRGLDVNCYLDGLLNPDTIGDADAWFVVETLIKYHKDWLAK